MKKTILIIIFTLSFCAFDCPFHPVQQTDEQTAKDISDLKAENKSLRITNAKKDSAIVAYQDSLKECRNDNAQLEYWKKIK